MNGKLDLVNLFPVPGDTTPLGQEGVPRGELADAAQWFVFLAFEAAEPISVFAWRGSFCCWEAAPDGTPVFACGGACGCGGCSTGEMTFTFEGCAFTFGGWSCSCSHVPPDRPGEEDEEEPDPLPGASARFSKRVILFEDEYEDAPGVAVPWRSTETELDCAASGGPNGGRVRIEARGADGLVPYGGLPLPFERELGPFESVAFRNAYRAVRPSGGEGDIVVTATFEENGTGAAWTSEDRATAVRVEVGPRVLAPENECPSRHRFGVGEVVGCRYRPAISAISAVRLGGGGIVGTNGAFEYRCPLQSETEGFGFVADDVRYVPRTSVVEPHAVNAKDVGYQPVGLRPGQAGGILLAMTLQALPLDVSFSMVKVEEIPDVGGSHSGYFADPYFMSEWLHGSAQGAGIWQTVAGDNEFLRDGAGFGGALPQIGADGFVSESGACGWVPGNLTWNVPCGWASAGVAEGDAPVGTFAEDARQIMTIDAQGNVDVRKHGHAVRRGIDGKVTLDGVQAE